MSRTPLAFLSYVNLDDQHDQGRLTQFRERLSGEVRMHTGEPFDIFQDRKDIAWGQQWQERLDTSLAAVTFLLPIITPAFFKSNACRAELERFLKREKELGRRDLILPVYYVNCPVLSDKADRLAQIIAARQYADWRPLRFKPFDSEQVCETLAQLAEQIVAALERSHIESPRAAAARAGLGVRKASVLCSQKAAATRDNSPVGTQNNYYGPQVLPPEKPKPKPVVRKSILTVAFMLVALLVAAYYSEQSDHQTDVVAQAEPAEQAAPPAIVETVTQPEAEPAATTKQPTVVVDAKQQGDYATITEAIEAAKAGTRILVRPGVYKEGIVIDKQVEIIGDGKRDDILIEASGQHTVVFKADSGRIANLTLRQAGGGKWYAVDITKGSLELEDCDISSQGLAGVAIHGSADPTLRRNRIHDGKASGVFVYENGQGTLEDNEIFANALASVQIREGGKPTLRRNLIHDGKQDGVFIYENGQGTLEDNKIFANALVGVTISEGGKPTLRRNRISKNGWTGIWVHDKGGGIFEANDLRGNTSGAWDIAADSAALVQRTGNLE